LRIDAEEAHANVLLMVSNSQVLQCSMRVKCPQHHSLKNRSIPTPVLQRVRQRMYIVSESGVDDRAIAIAIANNEVFTQILLVLVNNLERFYMQAGNLNF
jgi:uncharacterized protein YlxP (DUF503 family)